LTNTTKKLHFVGRSEKDFNELPEDIRINLSFAIAQLENGFPNKGTKSLSEISKGVMEVRRDNSDGWYRMAYLVTDEHVNVLHFFKKKTNKTPKSVIEMIRKNVKLAK
jgi:phage-related protein